MTLTLSHTDLRTLIRYLTDAAVLYDTEGRRTNKPALSNRARLMRLMTNKLSNKLKKTKQ